MGIKKGKHLNFDAMVKFFLQNYNIPTKKDVEKLIAKINSMEQLIKTTAINKVNQIEQNRNKSIFHSNSSITASDRVIEVLKKFHNGAGVAEIRAKTGFHEKKIRNIIFRLNNLGKIKRKSRGKYIVS